LWFRSLRLLRGLGIPPSVVPAPNKELHNDDAENERPHRRNGSIRIGQGQVPIAAQPTN